MYITFVVHIFIFMCIYMSFLVMKIECYIYISLFHIYNSKNVKTPEVAYLIVHNVNDLNGL